MASTPAPKNNVRDYKDLDLNFTIHPIRKDVNKLIGERAIINSVKNLLLTNHYERPFQPQLGSNIRHLLFEPLDPITASSIKVEIETTLKNFEPRIAIEGINVKADYDNNGFSVDLIFRPLNLTTPIQITFFLERVR